MDLEELRKLYREAAKVQDAAVRDALSGATARLAAAQAVVDGPLAGTPQDSMAAAAHKALVEKARKEIVEGAAAIAKAVKNPVDAETASAIAAEAIAAEAVAAEALAAEPLAAEPLAAEPLAAEPFVAEPMVAEPFVAEPVAAEPFAAEPFAAEPVAAEPASPLTDALNAFVASAARTESGDS